MIYNDLGVGYYVFRSRDSRDWLTGMAPTFELHVNNPLNHRDPFNRFDLAGSPDSVDLTFGLNFGIEFGRADRRVRHVSCQSQAVRFRGDADAEHLLRPVAANGPDHAPAALSSILSVRPRPSIRRGLARGDGLDADAWQRHRMLRVLRHFRGLRLRAMHDLGCLGVMLDLTAGRRQ